MVNKRFRFYGNELPKFCHHAFSFVMGVDGMRFLVMPFFVNGRSYLHILW